MAQQARALDRSSRLDNPINLEQWFPDRPYWSSPQFLREQEAYYTKLDELQAELAKYDTILLVGGSGPTADIVNNHRVHDLVLGFLRAGKPVAAECYGGGGTLTFARNLEDRKSIIWGKHVTGHCKE